MAAYQGAGGGLMSLDLKALQADVLRISDLYADEHGIDPSGDWALLKVQ